MFDKLSLKVSFKFSSAFPYLSFLEDFHDYFGCYFRFLSLNFHLFKKLEHMIRSLLLVTDLFLEILARLMKLSWFDFQGENFNDVLQSFNLIFTLTSPVFLKICLTKIYHWRHWRILPKNGFQPSNSNFPPMPVNFLNNLFSIFMLHVYGIII